MLEPRTSFHIVPFGTGLSLERGLSFHSFTEAFRILAIFKNRPISRDLLPKHGLVCTWDDKHKSLDLAHYVDHQLCEKKSLQVSEGLAHCELVIQGQAAQNLILNFNVHQQKTISEDYTLYLSGQGLTSDLRFVTGNIEGAQSIVPGPFAAALLIPWDQLKELSHLPPGRVQTPSPMSDLNIWNAMFQEFWFLKGQPRLLRIPDLNDTSACLVCISSLSDQNNYINYQFPPGPLPSPWRRLAQNLQLRHLASSEYDVTMNADLTGSLAEWLPLFEPTLAEIKMRIQKIGIVPHTLWES